MPDSAFLSWYNEHHSTPSGFFLAKQQGAARPALIPREMHPPFHNDLGYTSGARKRNLFICLRDRSRMEL
jgi:hypothetical protein